MNDFNHGILDETAHRPWPMPQSPWIMTQTWNDLLFAHWPVDAARLRSLVPASFDLDTFEGQAWVGIVPFRTIEDAAAGAADIAKRYPEHCAAARQVAERHFASDIVLGRFLDDVGGVA